jgi:hypothetical protein
MVYNMGVALATPIFHKLSQIYLFAFVLVKPYFKGFLFDQYLVADSDSGEPVGVD